MTPTVGLVLQGDGKDTAHEIGEALRREGGLAAFGVAITGLSRGALGLVHDQVATAVAGVLSISLGDVLTKAWRTHNALGKAARATLAQPGTTQTVDLATHRVTASYRPVVDVLVNEVAVASLPLELELVLDIVGLAGSVADGRLVLLGGGECHATASLSAAGKSLLSRTQTFDLRYTVDLGEGIPLLVAEAPPVH